MTLNKHPATVRYALRFLALLAVGCVGGEGPSKALSDPARSSTEPDAKGGLDGPAVAVAPFLDGVLPRRTPGSPQGSSWTTAPAFVGLTVSSDTIVISSNPGDDRVYVGAQHGGM